MEISNNIFQGVHHEQISIFNGSRLIWGCCGFNIVNRGLRVARGPLHPVSFPNGECEVPCNFAQYTRFHFNIITYYVIMCRDWRTYR